VPGAAGWRGTVCHGTARRATSCRRAWRWWERGALTRGDPLACVLAEVTAVHRAPLAGSDARQRTHEGEEEALFRLDGCDFCCRESMFLPSSRTSKSEPQKATKVTFWLKTTHPTPSFAPLTCARHVRLFPYAIVSPAKTNICSLYNVTLPLQIAVFLPEPFSASVVMLLHWVPHKDWKTISAPKSELDKQQTVVYSY